MSDRAIEKRAARALQDAMQDESITGVVGLARAVLAAVDAEVRADERRRCVEAWRDEGRDVMFNRAGDDLTPWERVAKWLSGLGDGEVEGR